METFITHEATEDISYREEATLYTMAEVTSSVSFTDMFKQ